jgi:hypothetical protein
VRNISRPKCPNEYDRWSHDLPGTTTSFAFDLPDIASGLGGTQPVYLLRSADEF